MTDPSARVWAELTADGGKLSVHDFISQKLTMLSVLLHRRVTRRYLEAHGISLSEWRMLALLQAAGAPISAVEANQRSRMDKGQISRSLLLLQKKRLVVRSPDPADGRRQILKLTAKAHATFDAIMTDARREQARVLLALSVTERKQLLRLMDRVTEIVEGLPSDDDAERTETRSSHRPRLSSPSPRLRGRVGVRGRDKSPPPGDASHPDR